jgi:putative Holliday junction resolvase
MILLGIDYGQARVGLALAEGPLAQPIAVFKNKPGLVEKVAALCRHQKVEKVIIGLPEGHLVSKIKEFGKKLKELVSLPVKFEPETLTTQEAIAKMIAAGKKRQARQQFKDSFAAALILQQYLDQIYV